MPNLLLASLESLAVSTTVLVIFTGISCRLPCPICSSCLKIYLVKPDYIINAIGAGTYPGK